jgi:hypothetical protein
MPFWTWQRIALLGMSLLFAVVATLWLVDKLQLAFGGAAIFLLGAALRTPGDSKPDDPWKSSLALLLVAGLAVASCAKTPLWPAVAQCSGDVDGVVGQVTQILLNDKGDGELSSAGVKELESLALRYGGDTVVCLIDELVNEWTAPAATQHPGRRAAAVRAEKFLRSTGTKVLLKPVSWWWDEGRFAVVER